MILIGVTGPIAAGKSAVAAAFAEAGAARFDADAEVWRAYAQEGREALAALFPGAFVGGHADRARLSALVVDDPAALGRLEALAHPLVAARRAKFLAAQRAAGRRAAALEIPLLFETGGGKGVDAVVTVDAPRALRLERAMQRPGMDEAKFAAIEARQMPAAEKRRRAHFVIETDCALEASKRQARDALRALACVDRGADRDA